MKQLILILLILSLSLTVVAQTGEISINVFPPKGLALTSSSRHLIVSWEPVSQPTGIIIESYTVWRGIGAGSLSVLHSGMSVFYSDATIKENRTYCYAVQAISTQGEASAMSADVCGRL